MAVPDLGSTALHPQERFLNCFDPDGHGGFVFRATPHSPGVSVTSEERAQMVAADDDRRGIATILYIIDLPLMAAVGFIFGMNPITKPWAPSRGLVDPLGPACGGRDLGFHGT